MYKILKTSKYNYYVRYYASTLSDLYADIKIYWRDFPEWESDKIDMTDWDKVERIKPKTKPKSKTNSKLHPLKPDDKLQKIINYLMDQILYNHYILQSDIALKGISKAQIKRTVEDSQLLAQYGLERIRATMAAKKQLGIDETVKGYPYIVCLMVE